MLSDDHFNCIGVSAPVPGLRLYPNLAELYHRNVAALTEALNAEDMRAEAITARRSLIAENRLAPSGGNLRIELYGELAALIALAAGDSPGIKNPRAFMAAGVFVSLVAGRRIGRDRHSLAVPI